MKKLLLALFFLPFSILGQCDLEILDFNVNDATITVAFNNTNNCGGTGGPDGISEIQFGFQAIDSNCNAMNIGWDFPSGISIPDNSNHPGWLYSATTTEIFGNWTNNYGPELQPPYYTGDTLTFPLDNVYQSTNINTTSQLANNLQYWYDEGYSIQAVIWQISYGPTMYAADGGWAEVGVNGDGTSWGSGLYDDANFLDNWIIVGPCEEPEETLILDECNDPIACNYNNQWFESGGFCIYCDTPNGEELCNEYHNSDGYWDFYFNAFDCENNDYPGCTDPFALNFDEEATIDDGTCVYSIGPDPIIIDITLTEEICQEFDAGVLSSYQYEATLVNIGTEAVTNFCLSDFLGTTSNCFNGVSNLAVWIQPGDTITVNGTINAIGTWVEGQGNFMSITGVPGEIITGNNNYVFYMGTTLECEETPVSCDTVYIEIQLPPDTIIQIETEFIYDTTYIELPPDTIIQTETEFVYDTTYIQLPPDTITITETEFIFITDTIYETEILYITDTLYITLVDTIVEYSFIEIDCATGLPCDAYGIDECNPLTAYIPNTFTPNNDGYNDAWEIVIIPECWAEVDAKVYNRWGTLVWESYDVYNLIWDGSHNYGDYYVPDGVYYWTFNGRKAGSAYVEELEGHVTILR